MLAPIHHIHYSQTGGNPVTGFQSCSCLCLPPHLSFFFLFSFCIQPNHVPPEIILPLVILTFHLGFVFETVILLFSYSFFLSIIFMVSVVSVLKSLLFKADMDRNCVEDDVYTLYINYKHLIWVCPFNCLFTPSMLPNDKHIIVQHYGYMVKLIRCQGWFCICITNPIVWTI